MFPLRLVLGLLFLLLLLTLLPDSARADEISQGARLVSLLDCNVCHTPKAMTDRGPRPDEARLLSGHPAGEKLPPVPDGVISPTGWGGLFNAGLTAWAGPWGISYGTNLTPDEATGIGGWTEEIFANALRTGMHVEEERPFLPPMPTYAHLTDEELSAIFAYLKSLKPVSNEVPGAVIHAGPPKSR